MGAETLRIISPNTLAFPLYCRKEDEGIYLRLLGGDFIQEYTDELTMAARDQFTDQFVRTDLLKINRRNAYRVMARLPLFLQRPKKISGYPSVTLTSDEMSRFNRLFLGTSLLLLSWNIGLGKTKIEEDFAWCRPYALLSQTRFNMIQRMIVLGIFEKIGLIFPKPGAPWLFSECAYCLQCISGLEVVDGSQVVRSMEQSYNNGRAAIERLKKGQFSHNAATPHETILNLNSIVEAQAQKLSERDKGFKKEYFDHYCKLETSWNVATKKLKPLRNVRRGRRLGQKKLIRDRNIKERKISEKTKPQLSCLIAQSILSRGSFRSLTA